MSLRFKTAIISCLALLALIALLIIFQQYRTTNNRLYRVITLLERINHTATEISSEALAREVDTASIRAAVDSIPSLSGQFRKVLPSPDKPVRLIDLEISFVRIGRAVDGSLPGRTVGGPLRQQIHNETEKIEDAILELREQSKERIEALRSRAEYLILSLAMLLVAYIVGGLILLTRSVIRPILVLTEQIEEVRAGERQQIEFVKRGDELGRLAEFARRAVTELARKNRELNTEVCERARAEEELKQSAATLENVLNNSNPLCITSIDFELVLANKSYYRVWPRKGTEEKRIKCYESRPGLHCHTSFCPMHQILQGSKEVEIESVKTEAGNREFYFIITARPFYNADGELIGMVESFQDITARKRAESALAAERENLAVTLRSIGDGVVTTDTEGRIVLMNTIAEELTGWSNRRARNRYLEEVFKMVDRATGLPCDNPVEQLLRVEGTLDPAGDTDLISREGYRRAIAVSGAPITDTNDHVVGVVLVFRDVTEANKREEELLKIKKLESLGALAGGIAHDFNNILAGIMCNISLATYYVEQGDEIYKLLQEAEKASVRAKGLTKQLLTFSKGGAPIRKVSSVGEIIEDVSGFILRGDNVGCNCRFGDDLWPVEIDADQISQVIQNIILNASQAMPDGGIIDITCENYLNTGAGHLPLRGERFVKIAIRDRGPGIPPDILERIFDPYFTTRLKGSGLGLAVSHSIVSKHGGYLAVESEEGRGATFTIYLAASDRRPAPEDRPAPSSVEAEKPRRILIMDDDDIVRATLGKVLSHCGHEVFSARDGGEAVALYTGMDGAQKIDLVIMDLTVPGGMGGEEAVGEILRLDPEARVIVSSGYSNDPVMANYRDYGFRAAVTKPFKIQELLDTVRRVTCLSA